MDSADIVKQLALKGFADASVKPKTSEYTDAVRAFQKSVGLSADGVPGPLTLAELFPRKIDREEHPFWPLQKDCTSFYGPPGNIKCTSGIVTPKVHLFYGDTVVRSFRCHELVQETFQQVFDRTIDHYGEAEWRRLGLDRFSGCFNVRKMRGGNAWSMHSWGIAYDLDAGRNTLHQDHRTAEFAKPAYTPYWEIVESEGLVSLGRARDFDWMHVQAARLS